MRYLLSVVLLASFSAVASEPAVAEALAKAGADQAAKGHHEQAELILYKALDNDENCGLALFELAKIEEKFGDPKIANTIYQRSIPFLKDKSALMEAERRLKTLNPQAEKLQAIMGDYVKCMETVFRRFPDRMTGQDIWARVDSLGLKLILPTEKLPKVDMSPFVFKPAGLWMKDGNRNSDMTVKDDGTVAMFGNTGKWKLSDETLIIEWTRDWGTTVLKVDDNNTLTGEHNFKRIISKEQKIR